MAQRRPQQSSIYSTSDVARRAEISENEAREWALELGVGKIGAAYAWTGADLDAVLETLEAEDAEDAESEDDGDDPEFDDPGEADEDPDSDSDEDE